MVETQDRVLLIDRDPEERAALVEAALLPAGYAVEAFGDAAEALARLRSDFPDVIVLDLHLGALSGRDVLVALNARGADVPVILLVDEGAERQALQAFRLGAMDYLVRPVREAELVQTVERALKAVRLRRDRETLLEEVRRAARQSERHLRDLSTLMSVGKALTSLRGLDNIFAAVARAAAEVTGAEASGLLLRDEASGRVILRSGHQLPPELAARTGQPVEDSLAALVMSSGETYVGAGEGLRRFNPLHRAATAVIYAPLAVQGTPVGLLWVANEDGPFLPHMADLMTALADYATIAIVNARLLEAMQARTQQLEELARPAPRRGLPPRCGRDRSGSPHRAGWHWP